MLANPPPQQQAPENTLQAPITGGDSQDIEQAIVARDLQGRSIHNDTVGPAGWTGETPEEREAFVKLLRPVDKVFLEKALPKFHVVTEDYANVPLRQAFNWDEVASYLGTELEGDWFIVAFRSVRKATADNKLLFEADAAAQREAIQSGGLLKYWYGDLNDHRECLAMCIWVNQDYARKATRKPLHLQAARLAHVMYDTYNLERYSLVKKKGENFFHLQEL